MDVTKPYKFIGFGADIIAWAVVRALILHGAPWRAACVLHPGSGYPSMLASKGSRSLFFAKWLFWRPGVPS